MAVKTITIDMEAYGLLSRVKGEGKSFSDVIKEHFGRRPTAAAFKATLGRVRLSEDVLDAVDEQIRDRQKHKARIIEW